MIRIVSQKTPSLLTLKFPKIMPKHIIYGKNDVIMLNANTMSLFKADIYRMADTETGEYAGEMVCRIIRNLKLDEIYPKNKKCDVLKIERLLIEEKRHGYGSAFLRFAEAESKKRGCGGKVFLLASRLYDKAHPSHIFYRKNGYTSTNSYINSKLDRCIQNNTELSPEYADNLLMYLPIKEEKQPQRKLSRLSCFLKNLIKTII